MSLSLKRPLADLLRPVSLRKQITLILIERILPLIRLKMKTALFSTQALHKTTKKISHPLMTCPTMKTAAAAITLTICSKQAAELHVSLFFPNRKFEIKKRKLFRSNRPNQSLKQTQKNENKAKY